MKIMYYHPGYYHNGFDNIQIKHNREMVGKICSNMRVTPPCTPFRQNN